MGLLVAGTKYRGEFEERLKKLMDEIKQNSEIILVGLAVCPLLAAPLIAPICLRFEGDGDALQSQMIDEVHTLIGAGAAEGAIDAANILKPALARGELQCIGATTLDEYRKHIEKDPALERCARPAHTPTGPC